MKPNYSKFIPHIVVLAAFWLITAVYFKPLVFDNYTLPQHDIKQSKGGAKELTDYREANDGEESMWTNAMFGGMPAYLVSTRYPSNLTPVIQKAFYLGIPYPVSIILLAFLAAYVMFLCFGIKNPLIAGAGAIGFGLASFMCISIGAGHNAKVVAIAIAPLVIGGIQLVFDRKYLIGFVVTALGIALEVSAGHIQITYYLFLLLLIYGISQVVFHVLEKKFDVLGKSIGILLLAVLLGVSTNASRLMTIMEYGKYSTRGKSEIDPDLLLTETEKRQKEVEGLNDKGDGLPSDYAFKWSQGEWENITFLVPHMYSGGFMGNPLGEESVMAEKLTEIGMPEGQAFSYVKSLLYSGKQPGTAGPIYMGAIICFLFVVGLFVLDNRYRWWLLAGVILSLMLSMGKNLPGFNNFMFNSFPGYNKFRTVSMTVVIAQFAMPIMAMLTLNKLIETSFSEDLLKKFLYGTGVVGAILLIIIVFTSSFHFVGSNDGQFKQSLLGAKIPANVIGDIMGALKQDRIGLARADAIRSLVFIALTAGIIFGMMKEKLSKNIGVGIIALLILVDLWGINKIYLNDEKYVEVDDWEMLDSQDFPLSPASAGILQDKSYYRVFDLQNPFNNASTSYYHYSVGGYHGAKMRRYQDLITMYISKNDRDVLEMLNVKYIIQDPRKSAVKLPNIGAAWFIKDLKVVENADEEILFLGNDEFKPKKNAVIDGSKFKPSQTSFTQNGKIELTSYKANHLVYDVSVDDQAFAVFSEIYYPVGWKVTIDGKEVSPARVNYVLRGLEIPKGTHKVEFKFEPSSYYVGETISLIGSILIFASIGVVGFFFYKSEKEGLLDETTKNLSEKK